MNTTTITITTLTASEDHCLTQSAESVENRVFGYKAYLAPTDQPDHWKEVTIEEAREMGFEPTEIADEDISKAYAMDIIANDNNDNKMKLTREIAHKLRKWLCEKVVTLPLDDLGDVTTFLPSFPFTDGTNIINAGTIFTYENHVKMALVTTYDQPHFAPSADNEGTLYISVEYVDGVRVIPDRFYGVSDAFHLGSLGWWNGNVYECLQEGCVYNPDVAPALWRKIVNE